MSSQLTPPVLGTRASTTDKPEPSISHSTHSSDPQVSHEDADNVEEDSYTKYNNEFYTKHGYFPSNWDKYETDTQLASLHVDAQERTEPQDVDEATDSHTQSNNEFYMMHGYYQSDRDDYDVEQRNLETQEEPHANAEGSLRESAS